MVVPWIPSSDLEASRRTESSRLSCVSPGILFVLKYCSLTRCEGRFPEFPVSGVIKNTGYIIETTRKILGKHVPERSKTYLSIGFERRWVKQKRCIRSTGIVVAMKIERLVLYHHVSLHQLEERFGDSVSKITRWVTAQGNRISF